jgi:hypothetical protein
MDSSRNTALVVEYKHELKDIESAVIKYFSERPDMADSHVDRVYELLIHAYKANARAATPPSGRLGEIERELYARVEAMCEWHLGRAEAPWKDAKRAAVIRTPDEIVACLKHLRKSVKFWTKESGRQGYLNYIKPYFS